MNGTLEGAGDAAGGSFYAVAGHEVTAALAHGGGAGDRAALRDGASQGVGIAGLEDKGPGDDLEEFGDELSSDYREEEEGIGDEEEELDEEVSYESEGTSVSVAVPSVPAPVGVSQPAPEARKAAPKAKASKSTKKLMFLQFL